MASFHIARGDFANADVNEQALAAPYLLNTSLFPPGTQLEATCGVIVLNNGSNVDLEFRLRRGGTEVPGTGTLIATGSIGTDGAVSFGGTFIIGDTPEFLKVSVVRAPLTVGNQALYSNTLLTWTPPVEEPITPVETDGPPADPDFGVDFDVLEDITPNLTLVSGRRNYMQAIARRFLSEEGSLRDLTEDEGAGAADYGFDVRARLNQALSLSDIDALASLMRRQCMLDPRTLDATVDNTFDLASSTLTSRITLETASGPFTMVLQIDAVTVEILDGDAS
jgi:hypothetical protein